MDVAGLRQLLDIYAYGKGEYPCRECEILRCVPALLDVAEAADEACERIAWKEPDLFSALPTMQHLTAALAALKED